MLTFVPGGAAVGMTRRNRCRCRSPLRQAVAEDQVVRVRRVERATSLTMFLYPALALVCVRAAGQEARVRRERPRPTHPP